MREIYDLELNGQTYQIERWPDELRGWRIIISGGNLPTSIERLLDNNTLIQDYEFRLMNTMTIGTAEQWAEVIEEIVNG